VIAQSSDTEARARNIYGARFIDRIPLAVERPEKASLEDNQILQYSRDDHLLLVTVGRLIARKGLDHLLEIVGRLNQFKVRLLIIGEGPLKASLQHRARALGIYDRVHFMGFLEEHEKWKILEYADLYISTTLHEGFCIAFLEAMAAGLPVVTYDNGGQRDFIDEETGILVPVGDKIQFLHSIERLLQNPELRRRLGDSARKRAMKYGIDRFVQSYLRIYKECVKIRKFRSSSV
jgi:glycosyltransferase involved in cell wall biosynthesis